MIPLSEVRIPTHRILRLRIYFLTTTPIPVFHGSELSLIFGPVPNSIENTFANQLTDFYINFVNDLNPSGKSPQFSSSTFPPSPWSPLILSFAATWPKFDPTTRQVLQLMRDNITVIPDGKHSYQAWPTKLPKLGTYLKPDCVV